MHRVLSSALCVFLFLTTCGAASNLTVLYETECPYSQETISKIVSSVLDIFGDNVILHLVPYGNARRVVQLDGSLSWTCQHGEVECTGNLWHACATRIFPGNKAATYAVCTLRNGELGKNLRSCAGDKLSELQKCVNDDATKVTSDMEAMTQAAAEILGRSRIRSVPTVLLNGKPVRRSRVLHKLCRLAAEPKPTACKDF